MRETSQRKQPLTHISLVLKSEVTASAATVEVSRPLAIKVTAWRSTVLSGTETLEALHKYGRRLAMVVGMHLNIGCAHVHLVAAGLEKVSLRCTRLKMSAPRRRS